MKERHSNDVKSTSQIIELLGRNPSDFKLEEALIQLEKCVKKGLIYQACELSDWISFIVSDKSEKLEKHSPLGQRLRIERLKRLGYLHFFEQEIICRDELCESEDLAFHLKAPPLKKHDHTRLILYTAIGHTLWHEKDLRKFKKYFQSYKTLFNKLTDECDLRIEMHAFLAAMDGRKAYLEQQSVKEVMGCFDSALNIMGPEKRRTRGCLHIINYYLDHLNAMYANSEFANSYMAITQQMELLFLEFDNCRNALPKRNDGDIDPIKTLLQLHVGVHRLRKMHRDQQLKRGTLSDIKTEIESASRDLMFTAAMLGLGSLNPCPPLLRDVYGYADMQQGMFDLNQAKEQLKKCLRKLDWHSFEDIAQIYFEHRGYKVERLPEGADTFDLLVHVENGMGVTSITGVQVRCINDDLSTTKFRNWRDVAGDYEKRNKIAHVLFFMKSNPHHKINRSMENIRSTFPFIQADIEFWNIDALTERLWLQSGCLPRIYAVIENSVRTRHLNEPALH